MQLLCLGSVILCPEQRHIRGQSCVVFVCEANIKEESCLFVFHSLLDFIFSLSFLKGYCPSRILLCQSPVMTAGIHADPKGGRLFNPARPAFPCTHCPSPTSALFLLVCFSLTQILPILMDLFKAVLSLEVLPDWTSDTDLFSSLLLCHLESSLWANYKSLYSQKTISFSKIES